MSHAKNIDQLVLQEIKNFKIFSQLSPELMQAISKIAVKTSLKKGEILWSKDDPGHFFALVTKGMLEISRENAHGGETVFGVFGPGDLIGVSAVLKKAPYPAHAISVIKDTEVVKLYIHSIHQNLNPNLRLELTTWLKESILIHEQILREKIEIISSGRLNSRLSLLFTHLLSRFGTMKQAKHKDFIPFPISKTQIARLIEARVETVIRFLSTYSKAGLVIMDKEGILIPDSKKLLERIEENKK